jgi:hypothetical protein
MTDLGLSESEAETFYAPAVIDYAFLEKYFIDAETHRSGYSVSWPVHDDKGHLQDRVVDTIPFPDALHALQISVAFLEKALKYLICIYGHGHTARQLRNAAGHNLTELVRLIDQEAPQFTKEMSAELTACLAEMQKIDYTVLRYLDEQAPEFEVQFLILKELLNYTFEFLKRTRWEKTHSDPAKREQLDALQNTIRVSVEEYRQPLRSIFKDSFEKVLQHQDLSEEDKGLISVNYRYDNKEDRYLLLDGIDDSTRGALFLAFEKAKFVFPDFGRLKIKIRH